MSSAFLDAIPWDTVASAVCIVTLGTVCFFVMFPTRLKSLHGDSIIHCNFVNASVAGVLFLRILDVVSLRDIGESLIQAGAVRPWAVLIIFFTLAYASVSVDTTGLSKFIALTVLKRFGGGSGNAQLVVVYLLSGFIALAASNDVVVLTLTPVLIHYCRAANKDPLPVLLAEYYGANTFSAILLVGNPTNIIAGQGMNVGFADYVLLLAPSCLVTIVVFTAVLYFAGERLLPVQHAVGDGVVTTVDDEAASTKLAEEINNPSLALVDRNGAVYGAIVLTAGISLLVCSTYTALPLWAVTSGTCAAMVAWDFFAPATDLLTERRLRQVAMRKMPWETAPFALSMFILVGALTKTGWTDALGNLYNTLNGVGGSALTAIGGTWLTVLLMNLLNNQPATIFMIEALANSQVKLGPRASRIMFCALAMGSNVAAAVTIAGALAGLMWLSILKAHDVHITWRQFCVAGIKVATLPIFGAGVTIFVQSLWW